MRITRLTTGDEQTARDAIIVLKLDSPTRGGLGVEHMRRFLSREHNYLLVAFDGAEPVGFALAYLLDRVDSDRRMMFFYEIGVAESHRRRGVGRLLVEHLKSICRELNVMKMWVETNRSNTAAMALYRTTGGTVNSAPDTVSFLYSPGGR